jgi:hypothetical protein
MKAFARRSHLHFVQDAVVGGDDEFLRIHGLRGMNHLRRRTHHIGLRHGRGRFRMHQNFGVRMLRLQHIQLHAFEFVMHQTGTCHSSMSAPVSFWM